MADRDSKKEELIKKHESLKEAIIVNIASKPGLSLIKRYATGMDSILRSVFSDTIRNADINPQAAERIVLLAQGGYGRHELSLYSDIDLAFVISDMVDPDVEGFIKSFLYSLWDLGLQVGYFVHTLDGIRDILGTDLATTTALIETRFIAGNQDIFQKVRGIIDTRIAGDLHTWFIHQRLADRDVRQKKWGASVYLLEPNIKEGKGGLRDFHSILWMGYCFWKTMDVRAFIQHGILSQSDLRKLTAALNFLHQLRNTLHYITKRNDNLLNFEKQSQVARFLGFTTDEKLLAEEKLMQHYYRHARFIESLSTRAMEEILKRYYPELSHMGSSEQQGESIGDDFLQISSWLVINPRTKQKVLTDPFRLFQLFMLCADKDLKIDHTTLDDVTSAVKRIDKRFQRQEQTSVLFMNLLKSTGGGMAQSLAYMHRTGFLELIIPEFKRVDCLVRLDFYHKYTVDEHLLRAVSISESLRRATLKSSNEYPEELNAIARSLSPDKWGILNLAVLLHDIGKGKGQGHVLLSAQLVKQIVSRLNLPEEHQEMVHFLVAHHQFLSHVAFRRNIEEPEVIKMVAKEIATPSLLDLLYVMTFCDTSAVAPETWNEWKSRLLSQLYRGVRHFIEKGEVPLPAPTRDRAEIANELLNTFRQETGTTPARTRIGTFVNNLPERYFSAIDLKTMAEHFTMINKLDEHNPLEITYQHPAGSTLTEICFATFDRPGLFRDLCLILSSSGINIINARIFTTSDGFCLDAFYVTDYYGGRLPDGFRYDHLKKDFIDLSSKKRNVEYFLRRQRRHFKMTEDRFAYKKTTITLSNDISQHYTVLEIMTVDRPWVLYTITSILLHQEINISLAFIGTTAYRVVDVFYITDFENNKIDDPAHIQRLKKLLQEALRNIDLQSYNLKIVHSPDVKST